MKKFGYPKNEKLKQSKEIDLLFKKGKWKTVGNIRIVYHHFEDLENTKIGVSASKRFFKKATDRNRIKRLLRESYRLNKEIFLQGFGEKTLAMVFWNSNKMPVHFKDVETEFLNLCKSKK